MNARGLWRYALFGVGLFGLLSLFESPGPELGTRAANFDLPLVGSGIDEPQTLSLSDHAGKPLLIEVFASWCGVCRRSAPTVARAYAQHHDELAFVGISVDNEFAGAEHIKRDWGAPYPVAHDADGSFARSYQIHALPTFILLDEQGHVRDVSTGAPSAGQLDEWAKLGAR
jgi:thiol-disulfide isomerase/thioredoxin